MDMTGGQALVAGLLRNDVRDIFFIPGIQRDWAVEAVRQNAGAIRAFVPRHAQSTTCLKMPDAPPHPLAHRRPT